MSIDDRRSGRSNVILMATVVAGDLGYSVRVSNISKHGVLIIGEYLPQAGALVTFSCNGTETAGYVIWSADERAGIQFENEIEVTAIPKKTNIHDVAIVKDDRTLDFRRPGFRGEQMTEEERRIVDEWERDGRPPTKGKGTRTDRE